MLSIVVPCYNEEEAIPLFFAEVEKVCANLPHEIEYVFVNDGSKDRTLLVLRALHAQYPDKIRYLSFSRNFGKEAGLYAGLQASKGELVTVMDVDLQDPPDLLPKMIQMIETQQLDCVGTRRVTRDGEPFLRSLFAKLFYKVINRIGEAKMVDGARDFRLMTRQMVDAILELTEYNRFSKGIFSWVGFDTEYLAYENRERVAGETSWSFWSLLGYSIDGIVNFSDVPLNIASYVGALSCAGSLLVMLVIFLRTIFFGDPTSGWPSLACIVLFVGGLQLLCLGIIGKYIGKIFLETKKRPVYIVKETEQDQK